MSAPEISEWQPIETAPKGLPTADVGCRGPSEWFLGLTKRGHIYEIHRRAWPQDDGWCDRYSTFYVPDYFTHWMPLPKPPRQS